jgi:predicted nucleotidyltransferase
MTLTSAAAWEIDELEALVLFGSRARGDGDVGSDTDIAAFGESASMADLVCLKDHLVEALGRECSLSVYSKQTAGTMAASGSLFLWHLRLEGRVLGQRSDWYGSLLACLQPYSLQKARADVDTFITALDDAEKSLARADPALLFEESNLFSILRSLGMIASMVDRQPCFSRLGPICYLRRRMAGEFSLADEEIETLRAARLFYSGKSLLVPEPEIERCRSKAARLALMARSLRSSLCL